MQRMIEVKDKEVSNDYRKSSLTYEAKIQNSISNPEKLIYHWQRGTISLISFFSGLFGFVMGLLPFVGWFFLSTWIIAIIIGIISLKHHKESRTFAAIGVAFGLLSIVIKVGIWFMGLWWFSSFFT